MSTRRVFGEYRVGQGNEEWVNIMSAGLGSVQSSRLAQPSSMDARGERLSAAIDGELPAGLLDETLDEVLAGPDGDARAAWSCYHLIGDVLRSDDLAPGSVAGAAFAARFAARLEAEPHVLAPVASVSSGQAAQRRRALRRWGAPTLSAAAAAVLTWFVAPQIPGMHGADGMYQAHETRGAAQHMAAQTVAVQDGNIIRDAHLDAYLEAHQQFGAQPVISGEMAFVQPASFATQAQ